MEAIIAHHHYRHKDDRGRPTYHDFIEGDVSEELNPSIPTHVRTVPLRPDML